MLTIVIPTADRHEFLPVTINNLYNEIIKSNCKINIIIADNSSNPPINIDTFNLLYVGIDIKLHRFDDRVDIGFSIIRSALLAPTEYVWVFGDDDLVRPGTISDIIWHLKTNCPSYIYLNRYVADYELKTFEKILHPVEIAPYRFLRGDDAVRSFIYHPGFITSLIFRRELLVNGAEQFEIEFPGYGFLVCIYANSLMENVVYISHPHLVQRRSNVLWKRNWPIFWLVAIPSAFGWLENKGVAGAKDRTMKDVRKIWIRTFFAAKAFGFDKNDVFWEKAAIHFSFAEKIVIAIIQNMVPVFLASVIYTRLVKTRDYIRTIKERLTPTV